MLCGCGLFFGGVALDRLLVVLAERLRPDGGGQYYIRNLDRKRDAIENRAGKFSRLKTVQWTVSTLQCPLYSVHLSIASD